MPAGLARQIVALGPIQRAFGASEQRLDVDADERGREEPDRGQHAEPATHLRRHLQRRDPFLLRDGPERPLHGVGGEDQVPRRRLGADRPLEPVAHHQVLRQRLGGPARLADHVHQHPPGVDAPERRRHRGRIHVLEHRQPGEVLPLLIRQLVPGRRPERVHQRPGPQRRPADPEQQDVIERLAHAVRETPDAADRGRLLRQPVEAVFPVPAPLPHFILHRRKPRGQLGEQGAGEAVPLSSRSWNIRAVEELHGPISTVRPSYAGSIPGRQARQEVAVRRFMRQVGQVGPLRADLPGDLDRLRDALVGGVFPPPERAQHQHPHPLEPVPRRRRVPASRRSRRRRRRSGTRRRSSSRDRRRAAAPPLPPRVAGTPADERAAGPAAAWTCHPGPARCHRRCSGRRRPKILQGGRRTEQRERRALPQREHPEVVDSADVVGVLVGVEHGIQSRHPGRRPVAAGFRRGCRSAGWLRPASSRAGCGSPVPRVGRPADRAAAADLRNPEGCARAEHGEAHALDGLDLEQVGGAGLIERHAGRHDHAVPGLGQARLQQALPGHPPHQVVVGQVVAPGRERRPRPAPTGGRSRARG